MNESMNDFADRLKKGGWFILAILWLFICERIDKVREKLPRAL